MPLAPVLFSSSNWLGQASRLIEGLDVVRQGYLTFEQVAAATLPRSSYVRHQLLLAAFEWLDGFHAGQITVDGIAKVNIAEQTPKGHNAAAHHTQSHRCLLCQHHTC